MFAVWYAIHMETAWAKEFAAEGQKVITLNDSGAVYDNCIASRAAICVGAGESCGRKSSIRSSERCCEKQWVESRAGSMMAIR